jgi:glycolate dehydrogenase FAD-binding subunit
MLQEADTSQLADEINALLGAGRVRPAEGLECAIAKTIVEPSSAEEIAELVRKCEADRITLAPIGSGRTLAELRRHPVELGISLSRMARIVAYEPDDMTVTAEAGLTLADLNARMAEHRQHLAVDPASPDRTTLGALVAAAQAGPLRLSEGTVRDLLIGIRFVGHGSRIVHGGGRVVKNVAGYDLMKVMTGSFGTLGIVTEVTFKVRPMPDHYALAVARFERADQAFVAASALSEMTHVEVLSPSVSSALGYPETFSLLAGFGGKAAELDFYRSGASRTLGLATEILSDESALRAYEALRDLTFPYATLSARLAVLPTELLHCLDVCRVEYLAHAACGIARIFVSRQMEVVEAQKTFARWRLSAHDAGGHVQLLSAAPAIRAGLKFFELPDEGVFKLMRRLKETFDPAGIFNPRCFVGGL